MITDSTTLKELNINYNDIGDDGISVVAEVFQHSNMISKLEVKECGLMTKGSYTVANS